MVLTLEQNGCLVLLDKKGILCSERVLWAYAPPKFSEFHVVLFYSLEKEIYIKHM